MGCSVFCDDSIVLIDLVLCVQKVDDDGTRHAGLYECILDRNYAPLFLLYVPGVVNTQRQYYYYHLATK